MTQGILKMNEQNAVSSPVREVLTKAFLWMFGGMILAAIAAWAIGGLESLKNWVASYPIQSIVMLVVWLGLSIGFKPLVRLVPAPIGAILFVINSLFTGLSLTIVIEQYTTASLVTAFVATVALFGSMTLFALTTKMDLSHTRFFVWAGVVGAVVFSVINALFLRSQMLDWLISLGLLILFTISTASSIQTIRTMAEENDPKLRNRLVIISAATLFTNFVIMFLRILRMFGQRKR